jgi:hypothetical protein
MSTCISCSVSGVFRWRGRAFLSPWRLVMNPCYRLSCCLVTGGRQAGLRGLALLRTEVVGYLMFGARMRRNNNQQPTLTPARPTSTYATESSQSSHNLLSELKPSIPHRNPSTTTLDRSHFKPRGFHSVRQHYLLL